MEYRLTFHALTIGSLAVCLAILATAWILELFGRFRRRPRYGMDHDDHTPGSDGRRSPDRESRHRPRTYPVEAFNADFRGRENNQAPGGQAPPSSGDFLIPVPRSLIVFPAERGAIGVVSAFAEP